MREMIDRVRNSTTDEVKKALDRQSALTVREYANLGDEDLTTKIEDLDREWDIERMLQTNASVIGLAGLALGLTIITSR